jgi:hypothetical protein
VSAGWHADVLRALGCFLDQSAAGIYVIVSDSDGTGGLELVWQAADAAIRSRPYPQPDLDELRAQARALRSGHGGGAGPNAELLRTIGQDLDQDGVSLRGIYRNADGFSVSGLLATGDFCALYLTQDVMALSMIRQRTRGTMLPS